MASKILLKNIDITQYDLRQIDQVYSMVGFIKNGGLFSSEAIREFQDRNQLPPSRLMIQLVRLGRDEQLFSIDGHHRLAAIALGGREYLLPEEYIVADKSYNEFMNPPFNNHWAGAYDPRYEIRLFEYYYFKLKVLEIAKSHQNYGELFKYIYDNRHKYLRKRTYKHIFELLESGELNLKMNKYDANSFS